MCSVSPRKCPSVSLRDLVDSIVDVSEAEIASALNLILTRMKIVVEPSSATVIAALLSPKFWKIPNVRDKKWVPILSPCTPDLIFVGVLLLLLVEEILNWWTYQQFYNSLANNHLLFCFTDLWNFFSIFFAGSDKTKGLLKRFRRAVQNTIFWSLWRVWCITHSIVWNFPYFDRVWCRCLF